MAERSAERRRERRREKRAVARQQQGGTKEILQPPKAEKPSSHSPLGSPGGKKLFLTMGAVGADYFSRRYDWHHIELLSSYGHDFIGPTGWWLVTQGLFSRVEFFRSRANILLASALSFGFEGMQYIVSQKAPQVLENHALGGRFAFDPYDLVAYTAGTIAALGLHRTLYGKSSSQQPTQ